MRCKLPTFNKVTFSRLSLLSIILFISAVSFYPQIQKQPARKTSKPKVEDQIPLPKSILLDNGEKTKKNLEQIVSYKDYCTDEKFCPDIDEIELTLRNNSEKFEKGKFEKTAGYENRLKSVLSGIRLGSARSAADPMVFIYESHDEPQYNADTETWTFNFSPTTKGELTCYQVFSEKTGNLLCLIAKKSEYVRGKVVVRMPPTVASTNDGKLSLALRGKIVSPFLWQANQSQPVDLYAGFYFQIEELFCLNQKSGQRWSVEYEKFAQSQPKIDTLPEKAVEAHYIKELAKSLDLTKLSNSKTETTRTVTDFEKKQLVNETLLAISIGLEKKEFSILYSRLSKSAKGSTSPEKIKGGLKSFFNNRKAYRELFRNVGNKQISFSQDSNRQEYLESEILKLNGGYVGDTAVGLFRILIPVRVNFSFSFVYEENDWKLRDYFVSTN